MSEPTGWRLFAHRSHDPDDATLMAGGLIALQRARAVDVHVLAIAEGDAADETADRETSAAQRRVEQMAALEELGVGPDSVTRLAIRNGAAVDHVDEIADAIAAFDHVGLVVAPGTGDDQRDHEAVGVAARSAVGRTGGDLVFGLFWMWHSRNPADLADEQMVELQLDADARRRRRRAIRCHRSQFFEHDGVPQLTPELVRPIGWQAEYFISPLRSIDHPAIGAEVISMPIPASTSTRLDRWEAGTVLP